MATTVTSSLVQSTSISTSTPPTDSTLLQSTHVDGPPILQCRRKWHQRTSQMNIAHPLRGTVMRFMHRVLMGLRVITMWRPFVHTLAAFHAKRKWSRTNLEAARCGTARSPPPRITLSLVIRYVKFCFIFPSINQLISLI